MTNEVKRPKTKSRGRQPVPPPPFPIDQALDMEYLSLADVAGFIRKSVGAVKKHLDGRPDGTKDEIGDALRSMLCYPFGQARQIDGKTVSAPRYIKARPFVEWYRGRGRETA